VGWPVGYRVWYGMVWYGMVWYGMVWYGMVWYGYRIIFIAKVLKNHTKKPKMQRFSKTIRKNKDAKVLKNHTKKPKMQRFSKTIRKNQRCKGSQKP